MKKVVLGLIILLFIGIISWTRLNPPLEKNLLARSSDYTSIIIGMGNNGLRDIQVTEVYVNQGEKPSDVKMQINHPDVGFIIADDFESPDAAAANFVDLTEAMIKKGTINSELLERQDKNQVREDDRIYGLSILNGEPINNVTVHYRYLGMPYKVVMDVE